MTAIEWFFRHVNIGGVKQGHGLSIDEVKEQALEMEKEQIIDAYERGWDMGALPNDCNSEQYYNKTFKK